MISIKTPAELALMQEPCEIVRDLLVYIEPHIKPGISTAALDKLACDYIKQRGGYPSSLGYNGFPAGICTSVDDVVVHGIPNRNMILREGQIVSVDIVVNKNGFHGDATRTFAVGRISPEKQRLIDVTKQCFFEGIAVLKDGVRLGDLGYAIQQYAESNGYSVVRELVGHGIGREMHEDPSVPNYGTQGHGVRVHSGMTIAVEPMINMGAKEVYTARDGWTVRTRDGLPSAHYENTVLITADGVKVLTL